MVSGSGFPNISTSYTVGTTELSWADLNLPEDAGNVYFSGCYPVQDTAVGGILTFTVSPAEETDLLLAEAVSVEKDSEEAVSLVFKHALHKLVVKYVSDDLTDAQLSEISTSVKALSSCSIDMAKGAMQNGTASGFLMRHRSGKRSNTEWYGLRTVRGGNHAGQSGIMLYGSSGKRQCDT